jgi:hypothetical protein
MFMHAITADNLLNKERKRGRKPTEAYPRGYRSHLPTLPGRLRAMAMHGRGNGGRRTGKKRTLSTKLVITTT